MATHVTIGGGGTKVSVTGGSAHRVTLDRRTAAVIADRRPSMVLQPKPTAVDVVGRNPTVRTGGGMGVQGPPGPPGVDAGTTPFIDNVSAEFTPMFKGTPVALVSGQFRRATSLAPFNEVVGLVMDDVIVPGAAGRVQTAGPLEQPALEWEVVTGMPGGLSPGALHFPSSSGHLTPFAPTAQGEFVVPTGRAASPTTFIIDIDTQVQL